MKNKVNYKKGDKVVKNGLNYIFDGYFLVPEQPVFETIDSFHTTRRNNK